MSWRRQVSKTARNGLTRAVSRQYLPNPIFPSPNPEHAWPSLKRVVVGFNSVTRFTFSGTSPTNHSARVLEKATPHFTHFTFAGFALQMQKFFQLV